LTFEWDDAKAAANLRKHGVRFDEAITVFLDPNALTVFDGRHSSDEDRYLTIGFSAAGRLVIVSHTDRGKVVRIISARKPTKAETDEYVTGP